MNEEIKKELQRRWSHKFEEYDFHPEYFESGEWLDIFELVEQAYLQGAKDMREAVGEVKVIESPEEADIIGGHFSYGAGQLHAIMAVYTKAKQFIDSLEKGENK